MNDDSRRGTSDRRAGGRDVGERYSSRDSRLQYAARSKRKRRRKRIVIGVLAAVLVAVLGVGGYALGLINKINSSLHDGLDDNLSSVLVKSDINNEPFYVLLMGTDASSDRESDSYFGGVFRTDTIILARVDPVNKKVTLISIPRDTEVDMGQYGTQKINAAHAYGGASLAVTSVEKLTGVQISHYVEVNFDGFSSIVDALGGVDVDVPIEINDADAGGYVAAGEQTLDGEQALILCRSRNSYSGSGDIYRSANQRLVLSAIASKLLDSDLVTITNTVSTMAQYVNTDMSVNDIISLAQHFKGFDSSANLYSAEFPTTSVYENEVWYEKENTSEWSTMLSCMNQGLSPVESTEVDPTTGTILATAGDGSSSSSSSTSTTHTGTVYVRNGTSTTGLAAKAAEKIAAMGFTTQTGNADSGSYTSTVVIYDDASNATEAQAIVSALGCGTAQKNDGSYINNGKFLVVIGSDYSG